MKIRLAAILTLILLPIMAFAEMDERKPGLYTIVDEESIPLHYTPYTGTVSSGAFVTNYSIRYKGATSGVIASDTFVMVIDPERMAYTSSNPFMRTTTPANISIIPLISYPDKNRREYEPGKAIEGESITIYSIKAGIDYEWEQISDNSFLIKIIGLRPGEYGITFRFSKNRPDEYNQGLFGFTIAE